MDVIKPGGDFDDYEADAFADELLAILAQERVEATA